MDGVDWCRPILTHIFNQPLSQSSAHYLIATQTQASGGGSIWLDLIIVFILILLNGFFSASEMAFISLNSTLIRKEAEEGNRLSRRILRFIEEPARFLSTIQVGVTFAGFLSSAFAGERFASRLALLLDPQGRLPWLNTFSLILVTFLTSYLSLVIGELVPKQIGLANPERFTRRTFRPIALFARLVRPFTALLTLSSKAILKLLGIKGTDSDRVMTEEEIRLLVDASNKGGNILVSESTMIQNIFEFNDKEVSEIMTHRINVSALDIHASLEEALNLAIEEGYTRLPVYEESIDNILGILNVKDLLAFVAREDRSQWNLSQLIREPYFTPESKHVDTLFREMQVDNVSLAIVIDEYGGVSGIVSMEDLLEEIVGNIRDEFDQEAAEITRNADGSYIIEGLCELSTLERSLPEFKLEDEDVDYDTVAGLVLHQLDRIPEENEQPEVVYAKRYHFKVLAMDERRIARVLLTFLPSQEEENEEDTL